MADSVKASWNPLRLDSGELAPHVLLAAKLIALCLLLTGHQERMPHEPFLPFLPFLDALRSPFPFEVVTKTMFFASALALLFNRWVRASAFTLGALILLSVVASKAYYGNNKLFCALFLILAGLQRKGEEPGLLRWQLAMVYFGAALNKALDPDWHSGQFFDHWARVRLEQPLFIALAGQLPPLLLGKIFCWATIATESSLAMGFAVRRFWPYAVWLGILFHSSAMWFTGSVFTMFYYAMNASYLAMAVWPKGRLLVLYDGDCGFCETTRRWFERLDLSGVYDWSPFQAGRGDEHGISREVLEQKVHVVAGERIHAGFAAFKIMLLYNPLSYFTLAVLLTAPGPSPSVFRNALAALLIALFFPVFAPIGEMVYRWIARNRHRLPGEKQCGVG